MTTRPVAVCRFPGSAGPFPYSGDQRLRYVVTVRVGLYPRRGPDHGGLIDQTEHGWR